MSGKNATWFVIGAIVAIGALFVLHRARTGGVIGSTTNPGGTPGYLT